ncbi:MAG: recombinase family protein [Bryobacteraceae bacterium]
MAVESQNAVRAVPAASPAQVRCVIYTRKSTDEGLDQDFNSLDAQRESAEAFILSQRREGWHALARRYDDGGYSGANMERPALRQLLADIEAGTLDCVVMYKLDRLTRSMKDFFKIMEILDRHKVTFVSVTQQFNTTTSIGRLALNIVMSFAEFERETISERTRDKMRAARRKGKWIGGFPILGYDVAPKGGALIVNAAEAKRVQEIFRLFLELGSLLLVVEQLDRRDWRMKAWTTRKGRVRGGSRFSKTTLYALLTNVIYTGKVKFEERLIDGEHQRIVDDGTFDQVQERLSRNGRKGGRGVRNKHSALLKGLVECGSCGTPMIHTYAQKKNTRYRYYICARAHHRGWNKCETRSVSAPELEGAVINNLRGFAQNPAMLSEVLQRLKEGREPNAPMADPGEVAGALLKFDPLWDQLTTCEQETFIRTLVSKVRYDGRTGEVTVGFHSEGIKQLCSPGGAIE